MTAITNGQGERIWEGDTRYVSNSELQMWKECHRKWYLGYYRRLGLKKGQQELTGARILGTRVHSALEYMYVEGGNAIEYLKTTYEDAEQSARNAVGDLEDFGLGDRIEALWKEYDLAHAMITGYIDWLAENGIDDGIKLVEAESILAVKSHIPGIELRGKMDQRVVRNQDGARLFRDFKTVGDLTRPTKTLHMDEQMKFYHLLEYIDSMDKTGGEPQWRTDGALYTMLRKVKRTVRAKPPFFGQMEVHHNLETIKNMWIRVCKELEEIFDATKALDEGADHNYIAYPRPSGDCTWKCDFFAVCSFFDDGSDAEGMLKAYYVEIDPDARYGAKEGTQDE